MANPHLVQYFQQIQNEISSRKIANSYSKAIHSLKLYPLPIRCGKDALILEGVGKVIADKIDLYYSNQANGYINNNNNVNNNNIINNNTVQYNDNNNNVSITNNKINNFSDITRTTNIIPPTNSVFKNNISNYNNISNNINNNSTNNYSNNKNKIPSDVIILDDDDEIDMTKNNDNIKYEFSFNKNIIDTVPSQPPSKSKRINYSPRNGSPPWAILIAFVQQQQQQQQNKNSKKCLSKSSLFNISSDLGAPADEPTLRVLEAKGLILISNDMCSLTVDGDLVATRLYAEYQSDKENINAMFKTPIAKKNKTRHRIVEEESDELCHQFSLLSSPSKPRPKNSSIAKSLSSSFLSHSSSSSSLPYSLSSSLSSHLSSSSSVSTPALKEIENQEIVGTKISPNEIPRFVNVLAILDNREVRTKTDRDYIHRKLSNMGVQSEVRALAVGDVMWIAIDDSGNEWVLDYIVERKKVEDLCASIIDGRYYEQKFRLSKCGCTKRIYVVEGRLASNYTNSISPDTLESALASTQVQDNTIVKQTGTIDETIQYLATMTTRFKTLIHSNYSLILGSGNYKCSFAEFCAHNSKTGNLPLSDLFAKQLMQIPGISSEKAFAISKIYPTPRSLIESYNSNSADNGANLLCEIKCGRSKRKLGNIVSREVHCLYTTQKY